VIDPDDVDGARLDVIWGTEELVGRLLLDDEVITTELDAVGVDDGGRDVNELIGAGFEDVGLDARAEEAGPDEGLDARFDAGLGEAELNETGVEDTELDI
jgi:hypothetical protein